MSSPLSVILTQNKLTGENFNDWKRNLLIVLNFEKHSFVLTQPRPPTPAIDAPDRDFVALERWDNSNLSAMCYIRASMSNVLQKQHEEHQTARQIMDNLEEMFGEQTIQAKTDAIKGLMNCRQKVGTPIKEHMMKSWLICLKLRQMGLRSILQLNWSWFSKPCPRISICFRHLTTLTGRRCL
ncbi:hypothetical protein TIFTF001_036470 [Ficus carica]|uniref:Retrotransposon Copia-like N-terminal domain-containing protein n=1 Tax=Ficus carica TaxID=3494 RepID=A0AA88JB51_FICCA|nr:hypothetical protein TIFTF001_036470 [Ficus carica]